MIEGPILSISSMKEGKEKWKYDCFAIGGHLPSEVFLPCFSDLLRSSCRVLTLEILVIFFGTFTLVGGLFASVVALGERKISASGGTLLAEGLFGVGIGLLTLFWPLITALVLLALIALWAFVTGVLEIAVAIRIHRERGYAWMQGLSGMASLLFGGLLILLPDASLLALTWLICIYALVFGGLFVSLGLQWRRIEQKLIVS